MIKFETYLNGIAVTIIGLGVICILIVTFVSFFYSTKNTQKIATIKIEYHGVKTDSLNELNKIEIKKIDSLLSEIKNTSNNIQFNQLQLIDNKENDNFFNKFYTAIAALVLSIAGFFGFKSIAEIKLKVIEVAKEVSNTVAKEVAAEVAKKEAGEVTEKVMLVFLRKEVDSLSKDIRDQLTNLDSRISDIEVIIKITKDVSEPTTGIDDSQQATNIDDNNDEFEDPFA